MYAGVENTEYYLTRTHARLTGSEALDIVFFYPGILTEMTKRLTPLRYMLR